MSGFEQQEHRGGEKPFNLAQAALDAMHAAGFKPEFGSGVAEQLEAIEAQFAELRPGAGVEDLRGLGWAGRRSITIRRAIWTRSRWPSAWATRFCCAWRSVMWLRR